MREFFHINNFLGARLLVSRRGKENSAAQLATSVKHFCQHTRSTLLFFLPFFSFSANPFTSVLRKTFVRVDKTTTHTFNVEKIQVILVCRRYRGIITVTCLRPLCSCEQPLRAMRAYPFEIKSQEWVGVMVFCGGIKTSNDCVNKETCRLPFSWQRNVDGVLGLHTERSKPCVPPVNIYIQ